MKLLILLHLLLILFSSVIGDESIKWNKNEISKTVKPGVRRFLPETKNYVVRSRHFHYKSHFGIIIQKNATFTLKLETPNKIEELYFHCLTSSTKETYKEISLKGWSSCETTETTLADCVPMISVSHNIPVNITITTKNWLQLPVFDTRQVTFLTSPEAEDTFFANVQTYGFVENYFTQMLISSEDIRVLKSKNYSLYLGLQNQADLVQYYDYLLGASRFANENEQLGYSLMEQTTMFLRTEPCDNKKGQKSDKSLWSNSKNPQVTYDKCKNVKRDCYTHSGCNYYAYYSAQWVAIISDVSEFLNPSKGTDWVLLHEVGHNYNIAPYNVDIVGFGETGEVWNNIYGALYQHKFPVKEHWMNSSAVEANDTITKYQQGVRLKKWDWRPKLHFFMSIFGFDGTDAPFREFQLRHYQHSERIHTYFNNIVPDLLEVFLDLHNVNLLPYLRKVLDFQESGVPLVTEDLELRLLSGHAVMPAMDFGIKPSDLQPASRERDFRHATPLVILAKVPKKFVWVKFNVRSPILLIGPCLYLNNHCYRIFGHRMKLRLLADVYSSCIVVKHRDNLYLSDVQYHTIAKDMVVDLHLRRIGNEDVYLPLVHYTFSAFGKDNVLISQAFVNYKNRDIGVSEAPIEESDYNNSWSLTRDGETVFESSVHGMWRNVKNSVHKFKIGDFLSLNLQQVVRLEINRKSVEVNKSLNSVAFLFTPVGIQNVDDLTNFELIQNDVERIGDFQEKHKIDLSGNVLYQVYLDRYARQLQNFNPNIKFPKEWLGF